MSNDPAVPSVGNDPRLMWPLLRSTRDARWALLVGCSLMVIACRKEPGPWSPSEEHPWMSGGTQTVFDAGAGAFGHPFPEMSASALALHGIGDVQFEQTFVSGQAPLNPGLGPLFNSVSCISCHVGDGRGRPPEPGDQPIGLLYRISVPGTDPNGGPAGVPGFGGQLQQRAIFGVAPEALIDLTWSEEPFNLPDGSVVMMRSPNVQFSSPYIPLPADLLWSARIAPPVFGLGLLEAIPGTDIIARADPNDADGDGISGRANLVHDMLGQGASLGRFGWKAEQPTLIQQCAGAYGEDMGITNPLFPVESVHGQLQDDGTPDDPELSDSLLHAVAFYVRTLAVPARRDTRNATVMQGATLFSTAKCDRCHVPEWRTGVDVSFPAISHQSILPYTDLLLHDMGPGLSDHRPSYLAGGAEWRTPPLWGIGLTQVVNGHQNFLHDGRARTLLEAILWHGGEGQASADAVAAMTSVERQALLAFLNSL